VRNSPAKSSHIRARRTSSDFLRIFLLNAYNCTCMFTYSCTRHGGFCMAAMPKLSGAELEIAQIVFRLGEARVRDVAAALPAERAMDFATVQTYLRRLYAKGFLAKRREGRADVY